MLTECAAAVLTLAAICSPAEPELLAPEAMPWEVREIAAEEWEPEQSDVDALARMLYGEARGVDSDMEKAACVWCVLNRVDDSRFPDTVTGVLTQPNQFYGYSSGFPVWEELAELAEDVLIRWHKEQEGQEDAGRVLPVEYLYFTGDGVRNTFRTSSGTVWDWSLENPYESEGG